ncbi:MAG: hypothetical protein MUF18_06675 [Fimbriiglobus sp.]|jgi:hypothetical protein|nr:hypothetical protein [Fimbriiglobus sp.]
MLNRLLAAALALALPATALACPFCSSQGQTLAGELAAADMIVVATVVKSERDEKDFTRSRTELRVDKMIKPHPAFEKRGDLVIPRYIPVEKGKDPPQLLLFCYVNTDNTDAAVAAVASSAAVFPQYRNASIDAYRGDEIRAKSKLPEYLDEARKYQTAPVQQRLAFYFQHLEDDELFISSDAYMEFGNADYKDVKELAKSLPADTLLKWLKDPNTSAARHGLYGLLLGHCGKSEHAATLAKLLNDPDAAPTLGLDGMFAGYVLLDPKAGWDLLANIAADRKREFTTRYAALRTVRFFHEHRSDVIPADKVMAAMKSLAEQDDIADIAIDDLRKWKAWDQSGFVFELAKRETHADPLVRRATLKFALLAAASGDKTAADYVDRIRKEKPKLVADAEALLESELPKKK